MSQLKHFLKGACLNKSTALKEHVSTQERLNSFSNIVNSNIMALIVMNVSVLNAMNVKSRPVR